MVYKNPLKPDIWTEWPLRQSNHVSVTALFMMPLNFSMDIHISHFRPLNGLFRVQRA